MRGLAILAGVTALLVAGCGYDDDNPAAVELVAQAYLDARAAGDEARVCEILTPTQRDAFIRASGGVGSCEAAVDAEIVDGVARRSVADVRRERFANEAVAVLDDGTTIDLSRVGSVWGIEVPPLGVPVPPPAE